MNIKDKNITLVTGGLGYIGSHTIVELLNNNHQVICIDNLSNSKKKVINKINSITHKKFLFKKLDLTKESSIKYIINLDIKINSIIHFAAKKYVNESIINPLDYYQNNILSTINTLKICNFFKKINYVFSSSCTVYGEHQKYPLTENSQLNKCLNPYGETKKICEKIIEDYSNTNKSFKFCSLRYFNPAGAHPSCKIGEDPLTIAQNLVPAVCNAHKSNQSIKIFGNNYKTKDGTCIRDYIHVQDVARAHTKCIEYLKKNSKKKISSKFNIGCGKGYSVKEVINAFEKVNNVKIKKKILPRRKGDIEKIWSKNHLVKKELNWSPQFSLKEIVRTAYEWSRKK